MIDYQFLIKNICKKAVNSLFSYKTLIFYFNTYLKSKVVTNKPSLYIVSYPKCGRTWLRVMLSRAAYLVNGCNNISMENILFGSDKNVNIVFDHDCANWVPSPKHFRSLKFNKVKFKDKRIIFLVRDPRDILVSAYMHLKYREHLFNGNISAFIRNRYLGIDKVIAFMNMWYSNRKIPKELIVISYEQVHKNTFKIFKSIINFAEVEISDDIILDSINYSAFNNMQKMEKSNVDEIPWLKPGNSKDFRTFKTRKGKIGGFKEELSIDDVDFLNKIIKSKLSEDLFKIIYGEMNLLKKDTKIQL